jgi:pimeloyl-ACP methyl ester carboxylesterase
MQNNQRISRVNLRRAAIAVCLLVVLSQALSAGEAILKNGVRLKGKTVPIQALTLRLVRQKGGPTVIYPILMVDNGVTRYFVPDSIVDDIDPSLEFSADQTFKLKQTISGRKLMLRSIGSYLSVTPFDKYGRRRVSVRTSRGRVDIIQGVTRIHPRYLTVRGLSHAWEHGIATTSIPADDLDRMIRNRNVTDQTNPDDRLAIARFYLQAKMYRQASAELKSIKRDFPELAKRADEVGQNLRQLQAGQLLAELRRRRQAGQHILASAVIRRFPVKNMSAVVLREVRELETQYAESREQLVRARMLLGQFQAELNDAKHVWAAAMIRSIISRELDLESLERLDAFLKLAGDDSLSADQTLALAFSGWVVGSAHAVTDFDVAVRLWDARFLVLEYVRAASLRERDNLFSRLQKLEGVSPEKIARLIPRLPPLLETQEGELDGILEITVSLRDSKPKRSADDKPQQDSFKYSVLLPQEYSPNHRYPLIVALRPPERSAKAELTWWGGTRERPGQSQRQGTIVIAPEYADAKQTVYDYGARAHEIVLAAINDARRRFNIDSDRIFLSGHGMGGTAAFDIGMSHPEIFAGVIPICGFCEKFCKWYWQNAKSVAWYGVGGEFDRDSLTRNAIVLNRMMTNNYDIIYAEYIGRGYESYYAEIHQLFDWMSRQRRAAPPKQYKAQILRPHDDRFFWAECHGLPRRVQLSGVNVREGSGRVRPMSLAIQVNDGLPDRITIYVKSGAETNVLWLSPDIVDFDKRISVRLNGRPVRISGDDGEDRFSAFLRPNIRTILDDFCIRGDRQRLFYVKLPL